MTITQKQYLMIENSGVCPVEGFTMLGLSTARDNDNSIGQFGSGNKHGVNILLRMGIDFRIFLGVNELKFMTKKEKMGDKIYNSVGYKFGVNRPQKLSWALEFGELDWDDINMALREFVSNALDAVDNKASNVRFAIVDHQELKERNRCTRVFIELTPEVANFYNSLGKLFLQYSNITKKEMDGGILRKKEKSPCRFYRKGVFVRELPHQSYYDYNLDNVRIDEARNMSDYHICEAIGYHISKLTDVPLLTEIMNYAVKDGDDCLEGQLNYYDLGYYVTNDENSETWRQAHHNLFGDRLATIVEESSLYEMAQNKGYQLKIVKSDVWYQILSKKLMVPTILSCLDSVNHKGEEILPPCEETIATLDRVWGWLEELGMTQDKPKPSCYNFNTLMDGGSTRLGYYKDGAVYLANEVKDSSKVMLEELSHYVTGSTDNSRDFQDYAFSFGTRLAELVM